MKKLSLSLSLFFIVFFAKAQTAPEIKNVAFFLQDGVEILDFAGPMEVFIAAGFNVFTVAETKEPIKAMGTLTVIPDYSIEDSPKPDMVAFFGGGAAGTMSRKENIKQWVIEQVNEADLRFSVCTGAFFLGEAGLLDGKTATTFHSAIPNLQERFPKANVRNDVRYVDNGSVITTAGISAGIDGALHTVAKIKGLAAAKGVAENMEYFGWQPDKGLVFENPFLQNARKNGLEKALASADKNTVVYKGEWLDFGESLYEKNQVKEALAVYDYLSKNYMLNAADYGHMRKVYVAAGRKVPMSEAEFFALVEKGNFDKAYGVLETTRKEMPNWIVFDEHNLNMLGYHAISDKQMNKAIEIFKLNVSAYPKSFNTYDSLGEAYMLAGNKELAIKNYEKSIELNPNNENGKKMLEKIRSKSGVNNKSK